MEFPRICTVGAGNHSTGSLYPFIAQAGGKLVGVCDMDADKASRNAGLFGGKAYTDMSQMLDAEKPDGVMICVGPEPHVELAQVAMQHGVPVYTEKPPSGTAAGALTVARMSKETGVPCSTAFKKRYNNCYNRAKEWLAGFGDDRWRTVTASYCSGHYAADEGPGSYLLDFAVHMIDLVGYLFGEVDHVYAMTCDHHAYAVSVRFVNGTLGTFDLNDGRTWAVPAEDMIITVQGGNCMRIQNSSCWQITSDDVVCESREPTTFLSGNNGHETGHLAEIEEFVASLSDRRRTRSDIAESYKSMVLLEAIRESAETGQVVKLAYEPI